MRARAGVHAWLGVKARVCVAYDFAFSAVRPCVHGLTFVTARMLVCGALCVFV